MDQMDDYQLLLVISRLMLVVVNSLHLVKMGLKLWMLVLSGLLSLLMAHFVLLFNYNKDFQDSQFPINFCESETCQCNVQLDIEKEDSMIAGGAGHVIHDNS